MGYYTLNGYDLNLAILCRHMDEYIKTVDKLHEKPIDFEDPEYANLWCDLGELQVKIQSGFEALGTWRMSKQ